MGESVFQEGVLVQALRQGFWIVLDELNLAPSDVLEALNRLLDDNRELLLQETQEIVRPHPDFMLFATQNPAGLYGGRKVLSRAFRSRFLELHFPEIPETELMEILQKRARIPDSWSRRIVMVHHELARHRQQDHLFDKKSFATLRDLFRWAFRKADTIEELAMNGYMLLAERVRKEEDRVIVKGVIETVMSRGGPRVTIEEEQVYVRELSAAQERCFNGVDFAKIVWTRAMRRLFALVSRAIEHNEPVLLVGNTGCGKTTICQAIAETFQKRLSVVNAHHNTETSDLLGAQRPVRGKAVIERQLRKDLLVAFEAAGGGAGGRQARCPWAVVCFRSAPEDRRIQRANRSATFDRDQWSSSIKTLRMDRRRASPSNERRTLLPTR